MINNLLNAILLIMWSFFMLLIGNMMAHSAIEQKPMQPLECFEDDDGRLYHLEENIIRRGCLHPLKLKPLKEKKNDLNN